MTPPVYRLHLKRLLEDLPVDARERAVSLAWLAGQSPEEYMAHEIAAGFAHEAWAAGDRPIAVAIIGDEILIQAGTGPA